MDSSAVEVPSSVPVPTAKPRLLLTEAVPGEHYEVLEVSGDDALSRRLAAAGLWRGAELERIASAPFGDPLLFRLHGYRLALRRSEARRVEVQVAPVGGAGCRP